MGRYKTEAEAKAEAKKAVQEAEHGTFALGPRQTVEQFLAQWLETVVLPNRSIRTYQTYNEKVGLHIVPEIGRVALKDLTAQQLQRLYAQKRKTLSPATVQLIHGVMFGALKQARVGVLSGATLRSLSSGRPALD